MSSRNEMHRYLSETHTLPLRAEQPLFVPGYQYFGSVPIWGMYGWLRVVSFIGNRIMAYNNYYVNQCCKLFGFKGSVSWIGDKRLRLPRCQGFFASGRG